MHHKDIHWSEEIPHGKNHFRQDIRVVPWLIQDMKAGDFHGDEISMTQDAFHRLKGALPAD